MRDLKGAVVVITGASSGIGRAAAQAFAAEGANLVLAARRESVLDEAVAECGRLSRPHGARAIAVPADVTDAGAVRRLAEAAVREFGHVDVWINNAGVGAVGGFAEVPADAHDQVVRTNLLGHMHGAHAILPHFQARRRIDHFFLGRFFGLLGKGAGFAAGAANQRRIVFGLVDRGQTGFGPQLLERSKVWFHTQNRIGVVEQQAQPGRAVVQAARHQQLLSRKAQRLQYGCQLLFGNLL